MKKVIDKNGVEITEFSIVNAPEPNETDIYNFEFQGTVADILNNGNVIVEDQESNFFEIEANRLEVVKD